MLSGDLGMRSVLVKSTLAVSSRTLSTNAYGEEIESFAALGSYKGYVQPRSDNINSSALLQTQLTGLEVIRYSHEAFIFGYAPKAESDRITFGGRTYLVRATKEWPTHAHCLLEELR